MDQEYKIPQSDFEVIEKFDSYDDDDLVVKMVEFYQELRDRNISLEDTYFTTLQQYGTVHNPRLVN